MINDVGIRLIDQGDHFKNKKYITYEFRLCTFCFFGFCVFTVGGCFGWVISQYVNGTGGSSSS